MHGDDSVMAARTGYALFDADDILLDASPELFGTCRPSRSKTKGMNSTAVVAEVLSTFKSFDGQTVTQGDAFVRTASARWKQPEAAPIEAETLDGRWKLLTSHPRPEGGAALVSIDITEMKRTELAHLESAEVFRCITDSHPLPVWVVDEESRQILYESLDASNLLGRKWQQEEYQYITDHYVEPHDFEEIRTLVSENDILRDYEIQLKRTNGSTVWCSTNCRRGVYHGRPSLIIGVLDITERKQREDLFKFLIKKIRYLCG